MLSTAGSTAIHIYQPAVKTARDRLESYLLCRHLVHAVEN